MKNEKPKTKTEKRKMKNEKRKTNILEQKMNNKRLKIEKKICSDNTKPGYFNTHPTIKP